jgi:hypothetical protein
VTGSTRTATYHEQPCKTLSPFAMGKGAGK